VRYLAVRTERGPAWDASRDIREQAGWDEHAAFMDGLVEEGLLILGGPIGDGPHTLLIFDAESEDEVRTRMGTDPWAGELLRLASVEPWLIWLDAR